MPDYLHLSPKGYRAWADAVKDPIKELLGDNSLSQAQRIAEMRKAAFVDVEALLSSGKLKIPKA